MNQSMAPGRLSCGVPLQRSNYGTLMLGGPLLVRTRLTYGGRTLCAGSEESRQRRGRYVECAHAGDWAGTMVPMSTMSAANGRGLGKI